MTSAVQFDKQGHIGLITLSRPESLNALTLDMVKSMQKHLSAWQDDTDIHAVLVSASPGKAFCAGGDVRWLYEKGLAGDSEQLQFFWHEYRLNHFIHQFKKPYIALMDGITMGGGVGISMHGSHPVASERFVFAMPETGIGLFPDIGASYLLSRCPGRMGTWLALTGSRLTAQDARLAKLVKYTLPSERFADILPGLHALDLSSSAHQRVSGFLQGLSQESDAPLEQDLDQINQYFSLDSMPAIMEKLAASDSSWATANYNSLQAKSPMSLAVTLEQVKRARSLSMADCIKMDYCLVRHFMKGHDFYEGVRALLIDKDKKPQWQPKTLADVTSANIADCFECEQAELSL